MILMGDSKTPVFYALDAVPHQHFKLVLDMLIQGTHRGTTAKAIL
jgi:hypothetical protein